MTKTEPEQKQNQLSAFWSANVVDFAVFCKIMGGFVGVLFLFLFVCLFFLDSELFSPEL